MSFTLLVIGGVAGGATAAARARRLNEEAKIILFERGEHISFANCGLPYYIGGVIEKRDDLFVTSKRAFMERYGIDVRISSEVVAIHRDTKRVEVRDTSSGKIYEEAYDKIILAPGAEPVKPKIPGIHLPGIFHLRTVGDSDLIKAMVDDRQARSAVIVGGGYIGLEMAENLHLKGIQTTVVEMARQVMTPLDPEMAAIVHGYLKEQGMTLELGQRVEAFQQRGDHLAVVTAQGKEFECDLIISAIGIVPENRLAKEAGLELGPRGHIKVNAAMATSDPDIYAVGDSVEVRHRVTEMPTNIALAGPANKQGRIAADNVMGRRTLYKGALGTSIVKVFGLTVAGTGANEKNLKEHNLPYEVSYTHSGSHASYFPGATTMAIKLIFSPGTGRILGAQIVGEAGVDKRIDVLATAIQANMTVFDLEELELAYAPPYSSAKDPINMAGFVAANILRGDVEVVQWLDREELEGENTVLIDLRSTKEIEAAGKIPGSVHIPMNKLRASLEELDRDKEYVAYCAVGMRGYLGYRILSQHGFKSKNLSGGFRTYVGAVEELMRESPDEKLWLAE
jgi:NADPH-dependent 2,4-dienoyl-CoA reductase/sulfur reductase-like enzyme/rhodanese-related sulfurtransferase